MKAIISGQAGYAILLDGEAVYSLDIESPYEWAPRALGDVRHLLDDARDSYLVKNTTKDKVVAELQSAWRRDRALQLSLLLLDSAEEEDLRIEAAACLDELLVCQEDRDAVANILYSSPLPDPKEAENALGFCKPDGYAAAFFGRLVHDQPAITEWCKEWEALPDDLCGGPKKKDQLRRLAVRAGAYRVFVEEQGLGSAALLKLMLEEGFRGSAVARKVLQSWAARFQASVTKPDFYAEDADAQETLQHETRRRKRRPPGGGLRVFRGVTAQKEEIKKQLEECKWDIALKYTRELVKWQRTNSQAEHIAKSLCDLAQHGKMLGDYSWHLQLSRWAVEEAPNDAWAHAQVGDAYRLLGDYEASLKSYQAAGFFGDEKIAMCGRAEILRENGQVAEALEVFETCAAKYPEDPSALCGRAAALASVGRLRDSVQAYRDVLADFHDNLIAETGLAAVLGELGEYEEAMRRFDNLIAAYPNANIPLCARAALLRDMGRLPEALQAYDDVTAKLPLSIAAYNGRARVLKDLGRLEDALVAYDQIIRKFDRHPYAHLGRADTLKKLGRLTDAVEAYRGCMQRMPKLGTARNGLASTLAALGLYDDALEQLQDTEPASFTEWLGYHIRSTIYLAQGRVRLAEQRLVSGLDELPWMSLRPMFRASLAAVRIRLRDFNSAAELVADVPPGNVWPVAKLIEVHACGMLYRRTEAATAYEELRVSCPAPLRATSEALAHRFVTRRPRIQFPDDRWLHQQECHFIFLCA